MLFDLRGKRKRFLQIIFALLAGIFTISFVGFGIGSDAGGGLFDAVGIGGGGHGGGGGNSPRNPQFERQLEEAEQRLEANPRDEEALVEIARVRFLAGQDGLEQDDQGNVLVSDESRAQFEDGVAAWQSYIDLEPEEPDTNTGLLVVESYVRLNDAAGAAEVQRILVAADPTSRSLSDLALYLYSDGQLKQGDKVAERAIAAASKDERAGVRSQLEGIGEQARQVSRQVDDAESGDGTAPNPFEEPLDGGGHSGG